MGYLLLPAIPCMRGKSVVEGLAIDILGVVRKVVANRRRKIDIGAVRHGDTLVLQDLWLLTRVKSREWSEELR
jgi:hypothetical protein